MPIPAHKHPRIRLKVWFIPVQGNKELIYSGPACDSAAHCLGRYVRKTTTNRQEADKTFWEVCREVHSKKSFMIIHQSYYLYSFEPA